MKQERNFLNDFRSGDRAIWKDLLNPEKTQYLHILAFAITENKEEAKDIVFSAVNSLWEKRNQLEFVGEDETRAYLYVTVRNNCIKHNRIRRAQADYLKQFSALRRLNDIDEEHQLKIANFFNLVVPYFDLLPNQTRQILKLSYVDGLSDVAIAEELRTTINTVYSQKSKGISKIKKMLKEQGPGLDLFSSYLFILLLTGAFSSSKTFF